MMGYPGAGKTTTAEVIARLTDAEHLSSDNLRMQMFSEPKFTPEEHKTLYQYLDSKTKQLLSGGRSVVYDANLNRLKHRQEKYDICNQTGAKPLLIFVKTPKELAKERASDDSRIHLWTKAESPHDMFERIANIIELPTNDEPYIELDGTKITDDYVQQALSL